MNPVAVAARGKGSRGLAARTRAIGGRYGASPRRMERRLARMFDILQRYGCGATLPITAAAAERHPAVVARYASLGVEFAVHGYYHVDHTQLRLAEQIAQLGRARDLLESNGVKATGFRAPYLRWSDATQHAVRENGYLYDSTQAVHWPLEPGSETDTYRRALDFYGSVPADQRPVLPWSEEGIIRIPYCLPDDEAVIDRLRLTGPGEIERLWLGILHATHERGEFFTLAVHPERIDLCAAGVVAVVEAARSATPPVWIAKLDQIARWWLDRAASTVTVHDEGSGRLRLAIRGPEGLTVLARRVQSPVGEPWADGYVRIRSSQFEVQAAVRPFIGVHPSSPRSLTEFLREQGYIVEIAESPDPFPRFLRYERFGWEDRRPLLAELEGADFPLVRLGRWPDGAKSAMAITGDVDALTIWDYAYRFLGR